MVLVPTLVSLPIVVKMRERNVEAVLDDDDLQVGSAGLLRGGAQGWVQIEAEATQMVEGVEHRPFLTAATSMDGSLATTYGVGTRQHAQRGAGQLRQLGQGAALVEVAGALQEQRPSHESKNNRGSRRARWCAWARRGRRRRHGSRSSGPWCRR
ncbi:MAG TPA: DUF932 domain-containing protein [Propionibacterium sp.]|nr:DUF932 domain-containing protein [Propionibacterium sp.]